MMLVQPWLFLIIFLNSLLIFAATEGFAMEVGRTLETRKGYRAGYILDVKSERYEVVTELSQIPEVVQQETFLQSEKIFTHKLTKEFQDQYREKFGNSYAEQAFHDSSLTLMSHSEGYNSYLIGKQNQQKREFGAYMGRRLLEYHVDNFAKNDPTAKPIYDLKEKVSKIDMQVAPGYKVALNYSISSNLIDFRFDNPFVESRARFLMAPNGFGPSTILNTILRLGYHLSPQIYSEIIYRDLEGTMALHLERRFASGLTSYLTLSQNVKEPDLVGLAQLGRDPTDDDRLVWESLIVWGLSWRL